MSHPENEALVPVTATGTKYATHRRKNANSCEDSNTQPQVSRIASFTIPSLHHMCLRARYFLFEVTDGGLFSTGSKHRLVLNVTL